MHNENKSRIDGLKKDINIIINRLYNEICTTAFELDKYRVPLHGIPNPSYENPMNLFQR